MEAFILKEGDTSPSIVYALLPASVILSGATVRFSMRNRSTGAVVIDRAAAVIVTATVTPTVRYDWQSADTASAGFYDAEFEVTYSDATVETFPNSTHIAVIINGDIA